MALSQKQREVLTVALANAEVANGIADAIDAAAGTPAADVAAVSAPNATDLASAETLANANKAAINATLAALKAAGLMA